MIETIYNQDNNEEEIVRLPKNIYQIGSGETKYHIYMEDKVSEFLQLLPENQKNIRYGVLLGNVKFSKGEMYVFVRAVVEVRDILDNTVLFGDDLWTAIYDDIKRYYHGEKIVGWYTSIEDFRERDLFQMRKIHLDHFAGNDKIFLNINREENEKEFYIYSAGDLNKVMCYHIYYEKNQDLERYIFETHYNLISGRKSVRVKADSIQEKKKREIMQAEAEEEKGVVKNSNDSIEDTMIENGETVKEEKKKLSEDMIKKENNMYRRILMFSGKAASVFVIGALVFTIGVMYKKGQLDNLSGEIKEVVAGIMNNPDTAKNENIVLLETETTDNGEENNSEDTQNPEETQNQEDTQNPEENNTEQGNSVETGNEAGNSTNQNGAQGEENSSMEQGNSDNNAETSIENSTEPQSASIAPENTRYYDVQKGDTLYGICKKLYGSTDNINVIMQLNNLESADSITYGKTLIVP